jgi:uncharacterized repeat protein (TIGR01451 family)
MNKLSRITTTSITGIAMAVAIASPAYAWHPKGEIVKSVKNVTTNGELQDANNASTAVSAKPGDTLLYSITISNTAENASKNDNDLAFVVMDDTLPAGVELASDPAQRQITENIGTILPGKSVTKQYLVKVTASQDGALIHNTACYKGDSVVEDNPQNGCDYADVKVTVPVVPTTTPTPTPTPTPVATPVSLKGATPEELPATGPASVILYAALATTIGYAANVLRLRRAASRA